MENFIGEIRLFGGAVAPAGWVPCHGQLLAVADNQELFALLGTTYGGEGQTAFAVPDLRGRVAVGTGTGPGSLSTYQLGQKGGQEAVALSQQQLPMHNHKATGRLDCSLTMASRQSPQDGQWARGGQLLYAASLSAGKSKMAADTVVGYATQEGSGGDQPHENRQPSLVVNYFIAIEGFWPG